MLFGLAQKYISELIRGRKIGITYDVDNEQEGKARGGIFAEHLIINTSGSDRRGQLSTIAIERGTKFSDNWRVQPRTLRLQIYVKDEDDILDTALVTTVSNMITGTSTLRESADLLDYLYTSSSLCDIKTALYDFRGYKLIDDPFEESWRTGHHMVYNTVWQEVPFYSEEREEDRQRLNGTLIELDDSIKKLLNKF